MKIAGRKNDGAWYRTNKVIHEELNDTERTALGGIIGALPTAADYFNAVQQLQSAAGLDESGDIASTSDEFYGQWVNNGIPRQAWMGVLSWDVYHKVTVNGTDRYVGLHATTARQFGSELRHALKVFVFARRQVLDLGNYFPRSSGNPGGIADATKGN